MHTTNLNKDVRIDKTDAYDSIEKFSSDQSEGNSQYFFDAIIIEKIFLGSLMMFRCLVFQYFLYFP